MEPIQLRRHLLAKPSELWWWRHWSLSLCIAGISLLCGACTVKVPVHPEVGTLENTDKLPVVTALLIKQETQGYIFHGYPENLTAGGRWHDFLLGEALEKAALQAFSQVFEQVRVVRTAAEAKPFQLVIEPTIEDFHFRYDQITYGPLRTGVLTKVTVYAILTAGDTTLWEHRVQSPWQRKGPWVINFSVEEEAGQSASEALAYALRTLAQEIAQDPSIRQWAAAGA